MTHSTKQIEKYFFFRGRGGGIIWKKNADRRLFYPITFRNSVKMKILFYNILAEVIDVTKYIFHEKYYNYRG